MDLTSFRVGDIPAPAPLPEGLPVEYAHGSVLAFDQSITATGWVHLDSGTNGVIVRACGTIRCPPDGFPKGHAGTLLRAEFVGAEMAAILRRLPVLTVVHELPAVGGKMARPESSLMTALALRIEARRQGHEVVIVQNQHSKMVLLGKGQGNASKKEWHTALDRLPWTHDGNRPTNEAERDAMCLGLTYLLEKDPKEG